MPGCLNSVAGWVKLPGKAVPPFLLLFLLYAASQHPWTATWDRQKYCRALPKLGEGGRGDPLCMRHFYLPIRPGL